jgi:hypothetical protein
MADIHSTLPLRVRMKFAQRRDAEPNEKHEQDHLRDHERQLGLRRARASKKDTFSKA